jgi:thiol-disulfide isomerase/thioredoxin
MVKNIQMKKFLIILALTLTSIAPSQAFATKHPQILTIKALSGQDFDLEKYQKNRSKVVIINFWAHWCANCRKEMLVLDEIYKEYKSQGLEIIGISIDPKQDRQKVLQVANSLSYSNVSLYEVEKTSLVEPSSIPTSYVIDREGNLVKILVGSYGADSKKYMEGILKPLLQK